MSTEIDFYTLASWEADNKAVCVFVTTKDVQEVLERFPERTGTFTDQEVYESLRRRIKWSEEEWCHGFIDDVIEDLITSKDREEREG